MKYNVFCYGFLFLFLLAIVPSAHGQWVRSAKTVAFSRGDGMGHDMTGNVYTTGVMTCLTSFEEVQLENNSCLEVDNTVVNPPPRLDIFLSKHNEDGTLMWAQRFGGGPDNELVVNDMDVDDAGNSYVIGQFKDSLYFQDDTLFNEDPTFDGFLTKVLPDGTVHWAISLEVDDQADISPQGVVKSGTRVFVTGQFIGKFQLGFEEDSVGYEALFIAAFQEADGSPIWLRTVNQGEDGATSLGKAIDAAGSEVLVAGGFNGQIEVENDTIGPLGGLASGGLIMNWNVAGTLNWKKVASTQGLESIVYDEPNSLYYLGGATSIITAIETDTIFTDAMDRAFMTSAPAGISGAPNWSVEWQSNDPDELIVNDISLNDDGNLMVAGNFKGTLLGSPSDTVNGNGTLNGFASRVDNAGTSQWLQVFGGTGDDEALVVSSLNDDLTFLGGYFSDYIRFVGEEIFNLNSGINGFVGRLDVCPDFIADMNSMDQIFCPGNTATFSVTNDATYTYQWFFNGAPIPATDAFQYVAADSGAYRAQITSPGCANPKLTPLVRLDLFPEPSTTISADGALQQCLGDSLGLIAPISRLDYQWYKDGVLLLNDTLNVLRVGEDADYFVEVTNDAGCSANSNVLTLQFFPFPSDTLNPQGRFLICSGDVLAIQADTGPGYTYQWFVDDDSLLVGETASVLNATETGIYYASVKNAIGCETISLPDTLVVQDDPVVNLNTTFAPVCNGDSTRLIADDVISQTYQWREGGVIIPGATDHEIYASTAGTYDVVVRNFLCEQISTPITVVVNPKPIADIANVGDTTVCEGVDLTLQANIGAGLSYQWLRNTLPVPGATNDNYVTQEGGNYQVEVSNAFDCGVTSANVNININPAPPAFVIPQGPTIICEGESTDLEGNPGTNLQYRWFLNGMSIPGANSIQLVVDQTGNYSVEVENSNQCKKLSEPRFVEVIPIPTASLTADPGPVVCERDSTLLQAGIGPDYGYTWFYNGFEFAQTVENQLYAGRQGEYQVVVNVGGCRDTSSVLFLDEIPNPKPILERSEAILSTSFSTDIQWFRDGQPLVGETDQVILVRENGYYRVSIINDNGCLAFSDSISMCVPVPKITAVNDVLTATPPGQAYSWSIDNNPVGGALGATITAQQSGAYSVFVTDSNGCTMETDAVVVCIPFPTIVQDSITGVLEARPPVAMAYRWYMDSVMVGGEDLNVLIPDGDGLYQVEITDFEGCTSRSQGFVVAVFTGIEDDLRAAGIRLYPNPVLSRMTIELPLHELNLRAYLYNHQGKLVHERLLDPGKNPFDLTTLRSGNYLLMLIDERQTFTWKIVKE